MYVVVVPPGRRQKTQRADHIGSGRRGFVNGWMVVCVCVCSERGRC